MNLTALTSAWRTFDDPESKKLLETLSSQDEDIFAPMFEASWTNWVIQGFYYAGLISCFGLFVISWFEKSGQAGPFRSLINQLVSMRLDQLLIFYVLGTGPNNLRFLTGPLPWYVCKMGTFFAHWSAINACHLTVLIAATKFAFRYIFKSMPVMNDDLLSFVILIVVGVWGFLATSTKLYLDKSVPLAEKICTGTWQDNVNEQQVPIMAIVAGYTFLFYFTLTIAVKLKAEKKLKQPQKYNNVGQGMDLSCLIINIVTTLCMVMAMYSFRAMNKLAKNPLALMENQAAQALRIIANPCLFGMTTVQALHHFVTNKKLRRAAWRIFFRERIVPVVE